MSDYRDTLGSFPWLRLDRNLHKQGTTYKTLAVASAVEGLGISLPVGGWTPEAEKAPDEECA